MNRVKNLILPIFLILSLFQIVAASENKTIKYQRQEYPIYPSAIDKIDLPSPLVDDNGNEYLVVELTSGSKSIVPVTVENGKPLLYSYKMGSFYGKDNQLIPSQGDFRTLEKTGFHSEEELKNKTSITGYPIEVINITARPRGYSYVGFIAEDEDVLSVLINDNRIAKQLAMKHTELAKPLFNVWNMILYEIELGKLKRHWTNILKFFYNGNKVKLNVRSSKGWQNSIFFDEVQGKFEIRIERELNENEISYLKEKYSFLNEKQFKTLIDKLSIMNISEMLPYYIMMYGFYEGHTGYRADPIAISYIFGYKSLNELEEINTGNLYKTLTEHFIGY